MSATSLQEWLPFHPWTLLERVAPNHNHIADVQYQKTLQRPDMSATARAEARRKAILSRGNDRLAKLTTSARGEDAPSYMSESSGSRSTSRSFLGEDSNDMPMPKPLTPEASPSPQPRKASGSTSSSTRGLNNNVFEAAGLGHTSTTPDPTVWSSEQQQQFMRALMQASATPAATGASQTPIQSPLGDPSDPVDPTLPPLDNPLAAMLFPQAYRNAGGEAGVNDALASFPGFNFDEKAGATAAAPAQPPSRLQRLMPLLHMLAMWFLLAYFVLWFEPKVYVETVDGAASQWSRWANLLRTHPTASSVTKVFKVQLVPFFWAFLSLEVLIHSLRIFSKSDAIQPPSLVALALPHLAPPFPSIIINSLKYIRMISLFLDDIAGLVVGLGFIIYFAGLFTN